MENRTRNSIGWLANQSIAFFGTGAVNDYQKDLQFKKLNAQKDVVEVKVERNGQMVLVLNSEIVVGDIMLLDTGDKITADGLLVENNGLVVDEASLTGESEPVKKETTDDLWCRSGTRVSLSSPEDVSRVVHIGLSLLGVYPKGSSVWQCIVLLFLPYVAETPRLGPDNTSLDPCNGLRSTRGLRSIHPTAF